MIYYNKKGEKLDFEYFCEHPEAGTDNNDVSTWLLVAVAIFFLIISILAILEQVSKYGLFFE